MSLRGAFESYKYTRHKGENACYLAKLILIRKKVIPMPLDYCYDVFFLLLIIFYKRLFFYAFFTYIYIYIFFYYDHDLQP